MDDGGSRVNIVTIFIIVTWDVSIIISVVIWGTDITILVADGLIVTIL